MGLDLLTKIKAPVIVGHLDGPIFENLETGESTMTSEIPRSTDEQHSPSSPNTHPISEEIGENDAVSSQPTDEQHSASTGDTVTMPEENAVTVETEPQSADETALSLADTAMMSEETPVTVPIASSDQQVFGDLAQMKKGSASAAEELRPIVRTKKFLIRVENTPAGPVQCATAPPVQIISSEVPSEYGHFSYLQHATTVTKMARIRTLSTKSRRDSTRLVCANYHRRARQCTTPSTPKSSSGARQK